MVNSLMRIGVDFDDVLFDRDRFISFLNEEIPGFKDTYPEARAAGDGYYYVENHLPLLDASREDFEKVLQHADDFVFDDAAMLQDLQAYGTVIIVSAGDEWMQERKIVNADILQYVDGYILVGDKSKDTANIDMLIDDKPREVNSVDMPTFLFNREEHTLEDALQWVEHVVSRRDL